MKPMYRGIAVAICHCLLVLSLAGKYAVDRDRLPRAWAKTRNFDPDMPVRGRYVSLALESEGTEGPNDWTRRSVRLYAQNGRLLVELARSENGVHATRLSDGRWVVSEPVAFFLPEHAADPTRTQAGEELWVEVSVPAQGVPRPLRLGIRKNGVLTQLNLR